MIGANHVMRQPALRYPHIPKNLPHKPRFGYDWSLEYRGWSMAFNTSAPMPIVVPRLAARRILFALAAAAGLTAPGCSPDRMLPLPPYGGAADFSSPRDGGPRLDLPLPS